VEKKLVQCLALIAINAIPDGWKTMIADILGDSTSSHHQLSQQHIQEKISLLSVKALNEARLNDSNQNDGEIWGLGYLGFRVSIR